jgi:hypothetical protein
MSNRYTNGVQVPCLGLADQAVVRGRASEFVSARTQVVEALRQTGQHAVDGLCMRVEQVLDPQPFGVRQL